MTDLDYATAYKRLLNKGYTHEHLSSLPPIIILPDDMILKIISYLSAQDTIIFCSISNRYIKLSMDHQLINNLYHRDFKAIDFLMDGNDDERVKILTCLQLVKDKLHSKLSIKSLYTNIQLRVENKSITKIPTQIKYLINLQELYIYTNLKYIPSTIYNLMHIKKLNLSSNSITFLPEELGNMVNLELLDLKCNHIFNLPSSFSNLQQLTSLELQHNNLSNIDAVIHLTKLVNLNGDHNKIIDLPKGFTNLIKLRHLNMNDNQLTNISIEKLTNLNTLAIRYNQITNLSNIDSPLTRMFIDHNNITLLNLSHLTTLRQLGLDRSVIVSDPYQLLHHIQILKYDKMD